MNVAVDASRIVTMPSQVPDVAVAVFVEFIAEQDGEDFADHLHTGVVFRDLDHGVRLVEQCWHNRLNSRVLRDSDSGGQSRRVFAVPDLGDLQVEAVAMRCRAVAKALDNGERPKIGYALKLTNDASLTSEGSFLLGASLGVTCVTLVLLVFRSAAIPLVNISNWPKRRDDLFEHENLVRHLRLTPSVPRDHVRAVESEVDCVRVRPEEVAGACLCQLPAEVAAAIAGAKNVLESLDWIPPTDHEAFEFQARQRIDDAEKKRKPLLLAKELVVAGDFYIRIDQLAKAKRCFERATALCKQHGDVRRLVLIWRRLARIAPSEIIRRKAIETAKDACDQLFESDSGLAQKLHWQLTAEFSDN